MKLREIQGNLVVIRDDSPVMVEDSNDWGDGSKELEFDGEEWLIFESREDAGQVARDYWEDMAKNDPSEFTCMVGEETLVSWALNQYAGPGTTQVRNLEEWLDLWLDTPEEHHSSYDGEEYDLECTSLALEALGFSADSKYVVAYRRN